MSLISLEDLTPNQLAGKRVLVREDLNVPMSNGTIDDDSRIAAALPTLKYLIQAGAKVIVVSHFGRPKHEVNASDLGASCQVNQTDRQQLSMTPISRHLAQLLAGTPVIQATDVVGEDAQAKVKALENGHVLVLENVRFEVGEEQNDPTFAKALASLADVYVNDAFGTSHRAHASTEGVAHLVPLAVAGLLMSAEIEALGGILSNAPKPLTAIVGGSKVSTKIAVLMNLLDKVDNIVIGGGMAYTFLLAQGYSVGKSLCEPAFVDTAKDIMAKAQAKGVNLYLSQDIVVADAFSASANTQIVDATAIPDGWEGMDIGPKSRQAFAEVILKSASILWNGPVGVFEWDAFAEGTKALAVAVAQATQNGSKTVLGGGDTVSAVEKFKYPKSAFTHVSTGGGASLEFIEGKALPGIEALKACAVSI
jgi:phosphoglycerate kinase